MTVVNMYSAGEHDHFVPHQPKPAENATESTDLGLIQNIGLGVV